MALHCEFVELPPDREADAPPLFCGAGDEPDAGQEDPHFFLSKEEEELERADAEFNAWLDSDGREEP